MSRSPSRRAWRHQRPCIRHSIWARSRDRPPPAASASSPSGEPRKSKASLAASAITSACGSARPISSIAMRTSRRAEVERVLAGIEHAGQIVERGIGVGTADGFVQRGDQIVVAVLRSCRRAARGAGRSSATPAVSKCSRLARGTPDLLGERERRRGRRRRPWRSAPCGPRRSSGTLRPSIPRRGRAACSDCRLVERLEDQHPGARQERTRSTRTTDSRWWRRPE